jgi:hypothetical protein
MVHRLTELTNIVHVACHIEPTHNSALSFRKCERDINGLHIFGKQVLVHALAVHPALEAK